jgi:hypothetical protein
VVLPRGITTLPFAILENGLLQRQALLIWDKAVGAGRDRTLVMQSSYGWGKAARAHAKIGSALLAAADRYCLRQTGAK